MMIQITVKSNEIRAIDDFLSSIRTICKAVEGTTVIHITVGLDQAKQVIYAIENNRVIIINSVTQVDQMMRNSIESKIVNGPDPRD